MKVFLLLMALTWTPVVHAEEVRVPSECNERSSDECYCLSKAKAMEYGAKAQAFDALQDGTPPPQVSKITWATFGALSGALATVLVFLLL